MNILLYFLSKLSTILKTLLLYFFLILHILHVTVLFMQILYPYSFSYTFKKIIKIHFINSIIQ